MRRRITLAVLLALGTASVTEVVRDGHLPD
jgi:hypothetical protein